MGRLGESSAGSIKRKADQLIRDSQVASRQGDDALSARPVRSRCPTVKMGHARLARVWPIRTMNGAEGLAGSCKACGTTLEPRARARGPSYEETPFSR